MKTELLSEIFRFVRTRTKAEGTPFSTVNMTFDLGLFDIRTFKK